MRILVISRTAWRKDNSFGNTYSSIFEGLEDVELANIYLADGLPETNPIVTHFYQISETKVIKSFFKPFGNSEKIGEEVAPDNNAKIELNAIVKKTKIIRWPIFFYLRDIIWKHGNIDYDKLLAFAKEFNPDILFVPLYYAKYVGRLALKIKHELKIPMVLECSLDVYSLKQVSMDPVFWVNRFSIRRLIRKLVKESSFIYTISEKLKEDYSRYLGIECKVLYKIPDFSRKAANYNYEEKNKLSFLFTGNIGDGRWETLGLLAKAIARENIGHLDIYTATPITNNISKTLNITGFSTIHAPVSSEEVKHLQGESDILVHVESFKLKHKLLVRYSISTKIMDYLCTGRTILAIGPQDVASIQFLKENNLALCASSETELSTLIKNIKSKRENLEKYSKVGPKFAAEMFDPNRIRNMMLSDFNSIIETSNQKYKYGYNNNN